MSRAFRRFFERGPQSLFFPVEFGRRGLALRVQGVRGFGLQRISSFFANFFGHGRAPRTTGVAQITSLLVFILGQRGSASKLRKSSEANRERPDTVSETGRRK